MPFNLLMYINAAVGGLFGVLFLIGPERSLAVYGLESDPATALLVRLLGALFAGSAVAAWFVRLEQPSPARRAMVLGYLTACTLSLVVMVIAMVGGVLNSSGWLGVAIFGLLSLLHGQTAWRERPGR